MADITFSKKRTFEGFTYLPEKKYEGIPEGLYQRLRHTFPVVTSGKPAPKVVVSSEVERVEVAAGAEEPLSEIMHTGESAWASGPRIPTPAVEDQVEDEPESVSGIELEGLPQSVLDALFTRFTSVEKIQVASDDEILSIPGIGPATLKKIRAVI